MVHVRFLVVFFSPAGREHVPCSMRYMFQVTLCQEMLYQALEPQVRLVTVYFMSHQVKLDYY